MATVVEEIHRAILPLSGRGRERWVMILHAYFDESGTGRSDPVLVLAGLLSTAEKWEAFSTEWQKLMKSWGLSYFHMSEFENGIRQYKTWRADGVHEERLNQLLDLICEYATARVSIAVSEERFRQVFGPDTKASLKYAIAARTLFNRVSIFDGAGNVTTFYPMTGPDADRIAFFFEAGARGIGNVQKVFNVLYKRPIARSVFKLVSFTFGGKEDYPPLQAADIVAYESYRHWLWQFASDQSRPHRYPWRRLAVLPSVTGNVSTEDMERWRPDFLQAIKKGTL